METIHGIEMSQKTPRRGGLSLWWLPALLLLFGAGQRHGLWGNDEPREAEISREIYASGDWVVPRLNGQAFLEKPPLAYWGAALAFHAAGKPSESVCRIPSAVWGLIGALATAWLGGMLAGRTAGLLAALILATCGEWLYIIHHLLVDVPLAACVALSLALFWHGYRSSGGQKGMGYLGCSLAVGGAFMAKGMVGVIIPGSAIVVFLAWRREWRELARLITPWNVAACVAVPFSWVIALWTREGTGALRVFAWDNQVLRFISPTADHADAPWYYLQILFEVLLPWVIFLPPAVLRLFRPSGEKRFTNSGRQYLMAVIAVPFIVLSIASGKRQLYLLPLLPGFAILLAAWIADSWSAGCAKWESLWHRTGLGLFAVLPVGSWGAAWYYAIVQGSGVLVASIGLAASVFAAGATIAYALRSRGERLAEISTALLILAYGAVLSPSLWAATEKAKGFADFERTLDEQIRGDVALYVYGSGERELGLICFHLRRTVPVIQTPDELAAVLQPGSGNHLLIAETMYLKLRAQNLIPPSVEIAAQSKLKRTTQLLLRTGSSQ
jgi:4-amino-4-deoxy-L-arabinose transferase-like glycosyltransferase